MRHEKQRQAEYLRHQLHNTRGACRLDEARNLGFDVIDVAGIVSIFFSISLIAYVVLFYW